MDRGVMHSKRQALCPEALMYPAHSVGITDELADEWGISKERIILEITEESAIHNCKLFKEAIVYYKKRGYKIAIDDFGAGYGGLKMLSVIEPDFVKIDRHFISNIDKATVKFNLDAITEKSLMLAKNANPLTGLPGNESIQREINKRLSQNMHFDVCYIDIDNFKPYNDHYGFEKGDMVIKTLACIIEESVKPDDFDFSFVGHIGGDDFIVIIPPQISIPACEKIIASFEATLPALHDTEDYNRRCYVSKNRKNEEETFNILSISIGTVSTEVYKIKSFAQLASIATEVKKAAKMQSALSGASSIARDRRLMG